MNDFGYHHAQFVGGHSDGVELALETLKEEIRFNTFQRNAYAYGDWLNPVKTKQEVYVRLPETSIYIFKRIE